MTPLFTVIAVARNEAKTLPRLVESLAWFQANGGEIILVDTGSTDGTPDIARSLGCTVFEGLSFTTVLGANMAVAINEKFVTEGEPDIAKKGDTVFDFGAARAFAASKAKNDWVCSIDCDEVFTRLDVSDVNKAVSTPGVGCIKFEFVHSRDQAGNITSQFNNRSRFYNRRNFNWDSQCILHEVLIPILGAPSEVAYVEEDSLKVEHLRNHETDRGSYLGAVALSCFLYPDNARNSFYFGRELFYKNRYKEAIREFLRRVEMGGWSLEVSQSMIFTGDCYAALGQVKEACEWWNKAFLVDGTRRQPLMRLAQHFYFRGDLHKTAAYASAALALPRVGFFMDEERDYQHYPHEMLYWALWHLGDKEGSAYHWRKAIGFQPKNKKYLDAAQFYLAP